ncbi:MAG: helix-turn-helix domain-containing protein [Alphaproteobacteria bacterium]|nr:helix-turn-helix domain-containing protein [Alphaproteobacteria bacterium]
MANNLKRLRKEQGLTVTELARRLSISQANLTKIENAQIGLKPDLAQKIATILNVSPLALEPQKTPKQPNGLTELEILNPEVLNLPAHTTLPVFKQLSIQTCFLYIIPDDTMAPTLLKHDLVILDTSCQTLQENGLYLINNHGSNELVRLQRLKESCIKVIFDNKNYESSDIIASELIIKAKALQTIKTRDLS